MSQSTILILLPSTAYANPSDGSAYKVVGEKRPAAAFVLGNRDLQTIQYSVTSFTGKIKIEATLSLAPEEDDWFSVFELESDNEALAGTDLKAASDVISFTNITGNFVYMRASIRDFKNGSVNFVKLSY